ncbi:VOC family protein [Bacillus sp. es.036]|uniref:VOC family protein n=1 Tax=Bacillus sp. es.036 TaxID=1761764 RepID=UPI000BF565FF|nr:VOC family protein [Bacillus sp. es.036]PFG13222.1 hypothetical protein ATG70_1423 [Bacillus sp. es.036]
MIERIDTLCMKVKNVEKSSDWYEELLGFSVVFKDIGYRLIWMIINFKFVILKSKNKRQNSLV